MKISPLLLATSFALAFAGGALAMTAVSSPVPIFDGKTLDGWIQQQNNASTFGGGDIKDLPGFAAKLTGTADPVSAYIYGQLDDLVKTQLAAVSSTSTNIKAVRSALGKNLNKIASGPSIYDDARFKGVTLRDETQKLLASSPQGQKLARLNRLLIEDAYPGLLVQSASTAWIVKDGAIASTGAGRGTLYTDKDFSHYRIIFTMRHVSGQPDHQACVLVFCTRPKEGEKPLDAIGGVQFQVPNGGHWDYRVGVNKGSTQTKDGKPEFTNVIKGHFNVHDWSQVEILVDATKGTARMAVAQPPGSKAVEVLDFNNAEAGKAGPFALQMHNGGLFDEYKDVTVEVDPKVDDLITTK
jgi:hypothetical protein